MSAAIDLSTPTIATPSAPYHEEARAVYANKPFIEWTDTDHKSSWGLVHTLVAESDQYIVVGQQREGDSAFEWQVVTYNGEEYAVAKQLKIFWNVLSRPSLEAPKETDLTPETVPAESTSVARGEDVFCNEDQIARQCIFEGREVVVLLNYAPHIAPRDAEPLDFLILPKAHREGFKDLREREYLEAMQLATKLFTHFSQHAAKHCSLYHKTGPLAGQTVKHWHLHVTLSTNLPEGAMEKVQSIISGLWRTPLSPDALQLKVTALSAELAEVMQ
jgi:diadenosine tetraphosphate (Ap4A) HIT family hydrolase